MEIKGYTWGYNSRNGMYTSLEGIKSRALLTETGINWVCLAFSVKQKSYSSTEILFDYRYNVTDLEIISAIEDFHAHNIKVCLKPMIDTADGVWRAYINFPDLNMFGEDKYWKEWFEYYRAYLLHYAEIAKYTGCEMFCLGCEMLGTERKEEEWRRTVDAVKTVYDGKLVYNTNHGKEEAAKWYDAIDYVGTSAYYPVAPQPENDDPQVTPFEYMKAEWEKVAFHLEDVSRRIGKPILFMEIGCRSAAGCASMPWDFTHRDFPYSEEEQANFYESCFRSVWEEPWFGGMFWWDWYTKLPERQPETGFSIAGKKAEAVVKAWYGKR
jgi:hypothetical protein